MMTLGSVAKLIRSKNAGPFMLTIDIIMDSEENYLLVKHSTKLSKAFIASLYDLTAEEISLIYCDEVKALKISFPRPVSSGDIGDGDVFGGQQHGPLVELDFS
ncbi:DUF4387 domain-containing protein [Halalkalibacter oceani]|uniref:DUF4387 domain-containing protein n=1 Tax=Halalkalibacter oceani TaxID=1653776 RepID=A0A9X2DS45_9BACI|nr:DUF4387 domain-containing protein [Halalkalibacter oceani]MCM3714193.1 DUF4387 domain-containing protein [Halalkalibacter oceani]